MINLSRLKNLARQNHFLASKNYTTDDDSIMNTISAEDAETKNKKQCTQANVEIIDPVKNL